MLQRPVTSGTRRSLAGTPWQGLAAWVDYTENFDTPEGIDSIRGVTTLTTDVVTGYATQRRLQEVGHGYVPSSTMWHRFDQLFNRTLSQDTTLFAIVTMPSGSVTGTTYTVTLGRTTSTSVNATIAIRSSDIEGYFRLGGGTPTGTNFAYVNPAHTAAMRDGKAHALALVHRCRTSTSTVELYWDGVLLASNTAARSGSADAPTVFSLGRFDRSSPVNSNGNVTLHVGGVFDRALSPGEVAAVSADPWWPWRAEFDSALTSTPPPTIPDGGGTPVGDGDTTTETGIAFGDDPLAASPTYVDVSSHVRAVDFGRGRSSVFQAFDAGTMTLVLDNRDGRFDPGNTAGPYYPNVAVGSPVRYRMDRDGTTSVLWVGNIDRVRLEYPANANDGVAIIEASENIALLVRSQLDDNYAADTTAGRVTDVLDNVGWPSAQRNISASPLSSVPAVDYSPDDVSRPSAWQHINDVAFAESGAVYINRLGQLVFEGRTEALASSSATFGDSGSDWPYQSISLAYDNDLLINRARVRNAANGVGWQSANDATSQGIHGVRTESYEVDTLISGPTALSAAEWIVARYATVKQRVSAITINPDAQPADLWPFVRDVDLRDVITVKLTTPGAGDNINQICRVEWLRHSGVPGAGNYTVTLGLLPVPDIEQESFFTLDSSLLDGVDVLA